MIDLFVNVLQLEVLELLVQNGADLNARTKHDETPAGTAAFCQQTIISFCCVARFMF